MPTPHFHRAGLPEHSERREGFGRYGEDRVVTQEYRAELARAAERNGFESILSITTHRNYDSWVATAALIPHTHRIKFIVALRPGFALPTLVAQQAATFQEISGDRLYINVVTGSHEEELRGYGDLLEKRQRYERTAEFFEVLKASWLGKPFSYHGKHYQIEAGGLPTPLKVPPKLFVGGSSPEGRDVGAKYADIHLSYGEPPPMVKEHVQRVSELADRQGRKVQFGILIPVIARATAAEAWRETDRLLDALDPAFIEQQQRHIRSRNSVSQARVQSLNSGVKDREALKVYPNIWAGSGLVGGGGGSTTLVGSYAEVAERIEEYLSVGIEHFIIAGQPALESSYEFGENVMPYFLKRGADTGEVVAPAPSLRAVAGLALQ
jgi:alkanesulfonate monooxygenase